MIRGVILFAAVTLVAALSFADTIVTDSSLIYKGWVASHEFIHQQMPDSGFICWSTLGSPYCDYGGTNPPGRGGFTLWQLSSGKYLGRGYALKDNTVNGYWAYWCWMSFGSTWSLDSLVISHAGSWFTGYRDVCDCNPYRGNGPGTTKKLLVPQWYASIQAAIDCAVDGDTILLGEGVYMERFASAGKSLVFVPAIGVGSVELSFSGPTSTLGSINCGAGFLKMEGLIFRDINMVGYTQSVLALSGDNITLEDCYFIANSDGGAHTATTVVSVNSSNNFQIRGCVFDSNLAAEGSAIRTIQSSGKITGCKFANNAAHTYYGGAIGLENQTHDVEVSQNLFVRNVAPRAGAIMLSQTNNVSIFSNTFVENVSTDSKGGAINFWVSNTNTLVSQNVFDSNSGYALFFEYTQPTSLVSNLWDNNLPSDFSSPFSSEICRVEADPDFCGSISSDYSVSNTSPCLATNNACAENIGAYGQGCVRIAVDLLRVDNESLNLHVLSAYPKYEWSKTGTQAKFEIAVGTDNDWQYSEMWNPAPFNSSDTFVIYAGAPLVDGQTYYLRLRISDGVSWSNWYYTSFHMNTPPTAPVPYAPQWPNITVSTTPDLSVVNSTDVENDTLAYDFEVYYDSMLTQLVLASPHVAEMRNPDSTSWTVAPPLTDNKYYYWRARAFDGYEYSPWSSMRFFIADNVNEPPNPFTLIDPPDSTGSILYNRKPTFRWTYTGDPDPYNQVRYKLELAVDPAFTFKQVIDSLYTSFWIPPDSLPYHSHHWWRVTAIDQYGATTLSPNVKEFWVWTLGDVDHSNNVDIADLSRLIDYLYISFGPIDPRKVGDLDGDCTVDIADLSRMIDYLYLSLIPLDVGGCGP